jgi:serine/threonine protein kinase
MPHEHSEENPVEVLAEEFAKRIRGGEHPSINDYVSRYPDHADEIESLFPSIAMMEQLKQQKKASQDRRPSTVKPPSNMPEQLGDFRILREIGRGGMGIVYEAWQQSLARRVALKVLPTEGMGRTQKQVERFLREAKSAGRLHHTNIVPVFGVGQHDGIYYYVMQLIEGYGLDSLLEYYQHQRDQAGAETDNEMLLANTQVSAGPSRQQTANVTRWTNENTATFAPGDDDPGPIISPVSPAGSDRHDGSPGKTAMVTTNRLQLDWQQIATIGIQVADALHYAHEHGILHRDIKPANLLIDQEHNAWITDFGLAKAADNNNLTQTGDVVGTLRYMAPEQFEGNCDAVSEVYSLGITLYELAALQPAFAQESRMELIRQIMEGSLPPLQEIRPGIPRDLETIIQKAASRDTDQRYTTAHQLAEDLARFRDDRPILARRSSSLQKVQHWSRRNPALAMSVAITACLLLLVAVTASVGYLSTSRALEELNRQQKKTDDAMVVAVAKRNEADKQSRRAEHNLAVAMEALDGIFASVGRPQTPSSMDNFGQQTTDLIIPQESTVTPGEARLLENMLDFYGKFIAYNRDDTTLQIKAAEAHLRVGKIQLLLGHIVSAKMAYQDALTAYQKLQKDFPDKAHYRIQEISIRNELGTLHRTNSDLVNSVTEHRTALTLLEKLPAAIRQTQAARFQRARTYNLLGQPMKSGPRTGQSETGTASFLLDKLLKKIDFIPADLHLEAEKILVDLVKQHPGNAIYKIELVRSLKNMIRVSNRPRSQADPWQLWHEARNIVDDLLRSQPDNPTYQYEYALLFIHKLPRGRSPVPLNRVRERLQEAIAVCDRLQRRYQHIPEYRKLVAHALYNRAEFEIRDNNSRGGSDRLIPARELIMDSIDIQRTLVSQFPDSLQYQIRLNQSLHRLTEIHDRMGRIEDARSVLEGTIKELDRFIDDHPKFEDARRILISDYDLLAVLLDKAKQDRFAQVARDKARALRDKFSIDAPAILPPKN